MDATIGFPPELWSRILRIYVVELNTTELSDWHDVQVSYSKPTLRRSAASLTSVCTAWRDLILSDPQFKVLRIGLCRSSCGTNVHYDIDLGHLDYHNTTPVALHWHRVSPYSIVGQRTVQDQMLRLAARLHALSFLSYDSNEGVAALQAFGKMSFEHLVFLELGPLGADLFDISPTYLSQIRAPLLTHLKFEHVNIFEYETKDPRTFLRFIQGLNQLQHLVLLCFVRSYATQVSERDPPDLLQSTVLPLTTLTLDDCTAYIVIFLRYLTLPHLETLKLHVEDWNAAIPNEGWYSPGFDFPELSLIHVNCMNLGIARFLSYSELPKLNRLLVGSTSLIRDRYYQDWFLPIKAPKLVSLTCGLSSRDGVLPVVEFWCKCCTKFPNSLCLIVAATNHPTDPSVLDRLRLDSPAVINVRSLAIAVCDDPGMKYLKAEKTLDVICGQLSGVDDLQLFSNVHPKDASHLEFLIPSAFRKGRYGQRKGEDILPSLKSLSLFFPSKGLSTPVIKKCANVESYVKERSSSGKRLARLVFNLPVAQKTLVRLEKYVDQVVTDRKGWERVYQLTGQKTWPLGCM